jgi:hypothetical protein
MGKCDFDTECYFLNVKTVTLPFTTCHARTTYCNGDFSKCTIYKAARAHGIDKIPRYVSPDDKYELNSRIVENGRWGSNRGYLV